MATKLTLKAKEAFLQYSKKMCTRVTIFWMIYRILNFVIVLVRPETAAALTELCAGVDTVMIVNMGTYTANSGTEKVAIAFGKRKSLYTPQKEAQEELNEEPSEELDDELDDEHG